MDKKLLARVTIPPHEIGGQAQKILVFCARFQDEPRRLTWFTELDGPETAPVYHFGQLPHPGSLTEARNILKAAFADPKYCLEIIYKKAGRPRGCKPSRTVTLRFTGNQLQALQARGLDSHPAIRAWILDLVKKAL